MRWAAILPAVFATFVSSSAFSQEYSYTHYDITEGLAGTMAYCMTQDAEGFIWVGTETGVSRFDGTHFRNFTTADGLPDIEVVQIFGDSKGRVWMAPFSKSVCYYYRGKIYNPGNDTLLSRISLKGNIEGFAEDAQGNVLIEERVGLHLVLANGVVRNIDSINGSPVRECTAICRSSSGHFLVQEGANIWKFSDSFTFFKSIGMAFYSPLNIAMDAEGVVFREGHKQTYFEDFATGKRIYRSSDSLHYKQISFSLLNDGYIYYNEFWGTTQVDQKSGSRRLFLPGIQVSRTYRDRDGDLWFTTLNHGIFRLNSDEFRTKTFGSGVEHTQSVTAMTRIGDTMWVGTDHNLIFKLALPDLKILQTEYHLPEAKDRVFFIDTCGKGIIYCTGYGVLTATRQLKFTGNDNVPVKWVLRMNSDQLLIGSAEGVMIYSIWVSWTTDTLWRERSTAGLIDGNTIYFGTMTGLYRVNPDRSVVFLGKKIPFLTKRISSMAVAADGTLWVASFDDAGIVGIRGDTVVAAITKKQGLTSDICRTLLIKGGVLWVGTDKGLNAVRLDKPGYPITRFTSNDGLASDMINMLYEDDSMMYVSTPAGLSFFNVSKVQTGDPCRLQLLGLINSGVDRIADTADLSLSYRATDIRFEFAGISYRSAGNIRYRYRMLGLDSNWRETSQTSLDYPSLPSGRYIFQLQAINKFGNTSEVRNVPFVVSTPFWNQFWFNGLELAGFAGLTWLFINWRVRRARRQQEERSRQGRRMVELEHIALQAQMNPHFIFNCLNSIQQFVFDKDMMATNAYISSFARLIRATLNHSSRPFISVAEEVEYLTDYLSLEKMRFKNKMDYFVEQEPGLDADEILLPPMLLQPYVENCVRHGLRRKTNGPGYVRVHFGKQAEKLVVTIRDNGIGRNKAMEYKTAEHIEYQSKGMSLTSSRIQMINVLYKSQIEVCVEDVIDNTGQADGTLIVIEFPVFPLSLR